MYAFALPGSGEVFQRHDMAIGVSQGWKSYLYQSENPDCLFVNGMSGFDLDSSQSVVGLSSEQPESRVQVLYDFSIAIVMFSALRVC